MTEIFSHNTGNAPSFIIRDNVNSYTIDGFVADEEEKIKALYKCIIIQAFIDYGSQSKNRRTKGIRQRAHDWILRDNKGFLNVCSMADISPAKVRKKFISYKTGEINIDQAIDL